MILVKVGDSVKVLATAAVLIVMSACTGQSGASTTPPASTSPVAAAQGIVSGHLLFVGITTQPVRTGLITLKGTTEFTVAVGSDGSYTSSVPPGRYRLTGRGEGGGGTCRAPSPVTVRSGHSIAADVLCQGD
jgi:hypothetical protein